MPAEVTVPAILKGNPYSHNTSRLACRRLRLKSSQSRGMNGMTPYINLQCRPSLRHSTLTLPSTTRFPQRLHPLHQEADEAPAPLLAASTSDCAATLT